MQEWNQFCWNWIQTGPNEVSNNLYFIQSCDMKICISNHWEDNEWYYTACTCRHKSYSVSLSVVAGFNLKVFFVYSGTCKHKFCWLLFCFRLKHAQSELKKKQSELKNTEKSYKKDKDVHDSIEKSKSKLEVCVQFTFLFSTIKPVRAVL